MKNLRKNKKGVSDVIAVLLMIAVAVAASLIAYAWVMGYLGGTTAKVGNAIQIQSMYYSGSTLYVYVQNVGSAPVTISTLYINGILENTTSILLPVNQTATVTGSWSYNGISALTVKVVCTDGTFMSATQIVPVS